MKTRTAFRFLPLLFAGMASPLQAAVLFAENFESRVLGPFVSASESGGDGTDWTDVAPAGWVRNQNATPVGGPAEFFGFTFMDKQSWINTEGNQERALWAGGTGTVMVADPDAYDDGWAGLGGPNFNVNITTPAISLANVSANTVTLGFDSTFRAEGGQMARVDVTFDGTNFTNLVTYDSLLLQDAEIINTVHSIPINNPGSGTMQFRFTLTNAGNNWWFAVDNINVQGTVVPEPSTGLLSLLALAGLSRRRRRA
jgi:hypothetical protein